jgi:hypothetical protein
MRKALDNCAGGRAVRITRGVRMSRSRDPVELRQNQMRLSIDLSMGLCACNYLICLMRFDEDRNCENSVWHTCTARI